MATHLLNIRENGLSFEEEMNIRSAYCGSISTLNQSLNVSDQISEAIAPFTQRRLSEQLSELENSLNRSNIDDSEIEEELENLPSM